MRFRGMAVLLTTLLVICGAFHYPPLWLFAVVMPVWLDLAFSLEEERIRSEMIATVEAALLEQRSR